MVGQNHLMQSVFCFYFFAALLGMWNFPDQGPNPCPLQWKCGVLTTGPPGKSYTSVFYNKVLNISCNLLTTVLKVKDNGCVATKGCKYTGCLPSVLMWLTGSCGLLLLLLLPTIRREYHTGKRSTLSSECVSLSHHG